MDKVSDVSKARLFYGVDSHISPSPLLAWPSNLIQSSLLTPCSQIGLLVYLLASFRTLALPGMEENQEGSLPSSHTQPNLASHIPQTLKIPNTGYATHHQSLLYLIP